MHFLNFTTGTDGGTDRHPASTGAQGERYGTHRHFLALPLFLMMLLVTMLGVSGTPRAQVIGESPAAGTITAGNADRTFSLARGVAGVLREDGVLRDDGREIALDDGTLLITAPGRSDVRVGSTLLRGFHGGFLVARGGGRFTVHALSTPVLLAHDGFRFIVPAGMGGDIMESGLPSVPDLAAATQMRSVLTMIPDAIAADALRELAAVPHASLPSVEVSAPVVVELQTALHSGDRRAVHELLRSAEVQTLLSATDLPDDLLPTLFADAAAVPSAAQELLQFLQDSDLWLLLSFHPDYRGATSFANDSGGAAWGASVPPAIPAANRELRLLLLPSSDVGGVAFPDHVLNRWRVETTEELAGAEHPEEFIARLLAVLEPFRAFAEANSYPERVQRTARVLQELAGPYNDRLSTETREQLAAWEEADAVAIMSDPSPLPPLPVTESLSSSSASPLSSSVTPEPFDSAQGLRPFDAAAVETQAKQLLLDAGALFTTQTTLHAESATQVSVQQLLFATADGEHTYDFTLDPAMGQLSAIERDGEALPYGLGLRAFAAWAKGE